MKKLLPTSNTLSINKSTGFTLVELMVVVAIIAILSVVGIVLFSGAQKTARDSVRRQDILSIAKALETNKAAGVTTYPSLTTAMFARQAVLTDPTSGRVPQYSILTRTDNTTPAVPTTWGATSANPTAVETAGTTVATVAAGVPANTTTNFQVCVLFETGTAPNIFCQPNVQ